MRTGKKGPSKPWSNSRIALFGIAVVAVMAAPITGSAASANLPSFGIRAENSDDSRIAAYRGFTAAETDPGVETPEPSLEFESPSSTGSSTQWEASRVAFPSYKVSSGKPVSYSISSTVTGDGIEYRDPSAEPLSIDETGKITANAWHYYKPVRYDATITAKEGSKTATTKLSYTVTPSLDVSGWSRCVLDTGSPLSNCKTGDTVLRHSMANPLTLPLNNIYSSATPERNGQTADMHLDRTDSPRSSTEGYTYSLGADRKSVVLSFSGMNPYAIANENVRLYSGDHMLVSRTTRAASGGSLVLDYADMMQKQQHGGGQTAGKSYATGLNGCSSSNLSLQRTTSPADGWTMPIDEVISTKSCVVSTAGAETKNPIPFSGSNLSLTYGVDAWSNSTSKWVAARLDVKVTFLNESKGSIGEKVEPITTSASGGSAATRSIAAPAGTKFILIELSSTSSNTSYFSIQQLNLKG